MLWFRGKNDIEIVNQILQLEFVKIDSGSTIFVC